MDERTFKDMSLDELLGELRLARVQQSLIRGRGSLWANDLAELEKKVVALKAELAQRPHEPRRLEKRAARQQAAKKFRGLGKSKDR